MSASSTNALPPGPPGWPQDEALLEALGPWMAQQRWFPLD